MNKKVLKNIVFILAICFVIGFSVKDVYAAQDTGYVSSPDFKVTDVASGKTYNLYASTSEVYGTQMGMYFHMGSTRLGRGFVDTNGRKMWVALWENDEHPNADEKIKLYSGQFSCGTPNNFKVEKTVKAGKVETNSCVEVYMRCEVDRYPGDDGRAIVPSDIFRYKIFVQ